jgi:hypothetical protein
MHRLSTTASSRKRTNASPPVRRATQRPSTFHFAFPRPPAGRPFHAERVPTSGAILGSHRPSPVACDPRFDSPSSRRRKPPSRSPMGSTWPWPQSPGQGCPHNFVANAAALGLSQTRIAVERVAPTRRVSPASADEHRSRRRPPSHGSG